MATALQSRRYAQAIFEIAQEKHELNQWQADLLRVLALTRNSDFVAVMDNPKYNFQDKSKLILGQIGDINPEVLKFVYLLVSQEKFSLVADIYSEFQELVDEFKGIEKAQITTAVPLSEKDTAGLVQNLEKLIGKKIILESRVDPKIIGGIIIKIGGKLIDGSTSTRLAALKSELAGTGV